MEVVENVKNEEVDKELEEVEQEEEQSQHLTARSPRQPTTILREDHSSIIGSKPISRKAQPRNMLRMQSEWVTFLMQA